MIDLSYFSKTRRIDRQAHKWVMRMLDDPQSHTEKLQRWMAISPDHQAAYKRVVTEVGYASDAATLLPSLRVSASSASSQWNWQRPTYFAAAAAVAGGVLVAVGWHFYSPSRTNLPGIASQVQTVSIADGEKEIRLADGSTVLMRGATTIHVRFGSTERAIDLLSGRARFNVKHDLARPFVVYAKGGSVTAVGTIFEVSVVRDVRVQLIEGHVRVAMPPRKDEPKGRQILLSPGEKAVFSQEQAPAPQPSVSERQSAPRNLTTFDDVPVAVIVAEVNRRSAIKIELVDETAGQQRIFAELNLDDADAVARKIATGLGLAIDRNTPGLIRLLKSH
ncbi:FecR domain-containing protein [Sphingobium sp. V4]|uniref:FecR family protein n=1 Tax=Sphingobium sp. V4 TaxID=3038927 RepID=UPI0025582609|nr:FecR domain-containing protein [Sphingobium sp. V4]WIW89572.1 FecR domain-containing protein [Sphingobium sp. V4]